MDHERTYSSCISIGLGTKSFPLKGKEGRREGQNRRGKEGRVDGRGMSRKAPTPPLPPPCPPSLPPFPGKQPGWTSNSWGYHGDDGHIFHGSGQGRPYGPTFGRTDRGQGGREGGDLRFRPVSGSHPSSPFAPLSLLPSHPPPSSGEGDTVGCGMAYFSEDERLQLKTQFRALARAGREGWREAWPEGEEAKEKTEETSEAENRNCRELWDRSCEVWDTMDE